MSEQTVMNMISKSKQGLMGIILGDFDVAASVCEYLSSISTIPTVEQLTKIRGVGESTARKILACMDLSATYMVGGTAPTYRDPESIARRFCSLKFKAQEHMCVMTLDSANHEIGVHEVTTGLVNQAPVHPREIMRHAILDNAVSIILVHNHPSGSTEPSNEDFNITRVICAAGRIMQIKVLDHLIVSKSGFTSLRRHSPEIFGE